MMKQSALIISNNKRQSTMFAAGLSGYGFHVETTDTLQDARMVMGYGLDAQAIIIDMKTPPDDVSEFIQFIREDLRNQTSGILVIHDNETVQGADAFIPRPANIEDVLRILTHA